MARETKTDYLLTWMTSKGEYNQMHYQWHMDALAKADELMEDHESGKCPLFTLKLITYETWTLPQPLPSGRGEGAGAIAKNYELLEQRAETKLA